VQNSPPTGGTKDPAGSGKGNQRRGPRISTRTWWILVAGFIIFDLFFYGKQMVATNKSTVGVSYNTFIAQLTENNVSTVHISGNAVDGDFHKPYKDPSTGKTYTRYTTTVFNELYNTVVNLGIKHKAAVTLATASQPAWLAVLGLLGYVLPILILVAFFYFGTRAARSQQQGIFGFGQSRAKQYTEERPSTTFADVAGVQGAKRELHEIVDFLSDPGKYHRLGARIPKGVLLVGPPGTGKTLLARAVAGEAHVPFFSISSSEFVELFVGVGASRVRDLFDRAKAVSPAIIFVDEIDAIGGRRGSRAGGFGVNDEREQTLNQLLTSMDGFEPNEAVIVLAATNRPDVLDPALLRPGRFDREVTLDPPDRVGREAILRIHSKGIPLGPDVDLMALAQQTPGMTGADLANLCNEAALEAARVGRSQVSQQNFLDALDRVTLGIEGAPLMNADERRTVAYHEGGHALVAFLLPNVDPVSRVTITPRGRSLGVTQFRPIDDRRNYRRDYLIDRMAVGMGGRSAEEIACEEITSGAQNDFQQVTNTARVMVTELGMADDLGPTFFGSGNGSASGGGYGPFEQREYSDDTAARIDAAVERFVSEAHDTARAILTENRQTLDAIAAALMKDESLSSEQLADVVNAHRVPGQKTLAAGPDPDGQPAAELAAEVPSS
jgi:cell division protease FtsH